MSTPATITAIKSPRRNSAIQWSFHQRSTSTTFRPFLEETPCTAVPDEPNNIPNRLVAGVLPGVDGLAFRIDSIGINRPLIFESIAMNDIFEPGEIWQFVVQDYASPVGPPDAFPSIGFADASWAVLDTSTASIVHFVVPEPMTASCLPGRIVGAVGDQASLVIKSTR